MSLRSLNIAFVLGCLPLVATAATPAQPNAPAPLDDLTTLMEAQQQRIETLRTQLAQQQQNTDAGREQITRAQVREILGDREFREELMPSVLQAGYDRGFFLRSGDDRFLIKFGGRLQARWSYLQRSERNRYLAPRTSRDDLSGFDVQRIRFTLKGHVYDPNLTYRLTLRSGAGERYDAAVHYAWLNYRFCDAFQVMTGIFKSAALRQEMISSAKLNFVDRSMVNELFTIDRVLGVRFWGSLFERRLDYYVDIVNAFDEETNRTITPDPPEMDNNPGVIVRGIWHALGDNPKSMMSEGDVEWHETPGFDLGAHYAFNEDDGDSSGTVVAFRRASLLPGGFGNTLANGLQTHQLGVDAAFKWQGFSAQAEYVWLFLDVRQAGRTPFAPYWLLTGDGSTSDYHGGYLQLGYFLPIPGLERKLEVVGRVGGVSSIGPGSEGVWEYAAGVNYYIQGHNVKLQADVTRIPEIPVRSGSASLPNVNDDALVFRLQLQVAF